MNYDLFRLKKTFDSIGQSLIWTNTAQMIQTFLPLPVALPGSNPAAGEDLFPNMTVEACSIVLLTALLALLVRHHFG